MNYQHGYLHGSGSSSYWSYITVIPTSGSYLNVIISEPVITVTYAQSCGATCSHYKSGLAGFCQKGGKTVFFHGKN